jgi:hypothetical protein
MPFYKTTFNILKEPWKDELFNEELFNGPEVYIPPTKEWDYSRQLKIEDVDIWEVIYEQGGGVGVYASHEPLAEFYMIRVGWQLEQQGYGIETYYGPGSVKRVMKRMDELGLPYGKRKVWVDPEDMWLYEGKQ